jgi:hypothetical protein
VQGVPDRRLGLVAAHVGLNALFSLTILPLVLPPFRGYTAAQLAEVAFWQTLGVVGWPLVIAGALLTLPFGASLRTIASLAIALTYPGILILIVRAATRQVRGHEFLLLHLLMAISFGAIWRGVLNGYAFMPG